MLKEYLDQFIRLSSEEFETLMSLAKKITLKRNEYFIQEGAYCNKIAFLTSGIVRYYHTLEGKEKTRDFVLKNNFFTAYQSLITGKPSHSSIQALDDCEIWVWFYPKILALYDKYPKFNHLGRLLAEQSFINLNEDYIRLLKEDALSKYEDLMNHTPEIFQKVPLQYIASFLNISPQHLSRIRKTVSQKI